MSRSPSIPPAGGLCSKVFGLERSQVRIQVRTVYQPDFLRTVCTGKMGSTKVRVNGAYGLPPTALPETVVDKLKGCKPWQAILG